MQIITSCSLVLSARFPLHASELYQVTQVSARQLLLEEPPLCDDGQQNYLYLSVDTNSQRRMIQPPLSPPQSKGTVDGTDPTEE